MKHLLLLWKHDDARGGLVYIILLILTLRFDRSMDLAFGISDWNEILGKVVSWENIVPYWMAMWLFYFPALLLLFSLACKSLIPLLWGSVVQLSGIHDYLYFLLHGLGMPEELSYLEGTVAWQMAEALGFEALTPFSLLITSVIGVAVGAVLSVIYLIVRWRKLGMNHTQ